MTDRAVRKAIAARRWRGAELVVREVASNVGRGGKSLQVHVDSLPADLRAAWYMRQGIDINAKPQAGDGQRVAVANHTLSDDPDWLAQTALAEFKLSIIKPLMALPERSKERSDAADALTGTVLEWPDGSRKTISRATLYNWISAYKTGGLYGLVRKKRSDSKATRCLVTMSWDAFFLQRAAEKDCRRVADDLTGYIRSLWASGEPGWRSICEKSTTKLIELSDSLGVDAFSALDQGRLGDQAGTLTRFGICAVNRRRAEDERDYAVIAVKNKDNAVYQDKIAATIRRDYSSLRPRDIVVGDVHPVDVMMTRPDGSKVYPKAISWFDPATNEIHMTFALLEKGEGVRREHVAMSFEAMVSEWGLPKLLYLDNGSEYKWNEMIGGFTMLSKLANFAVHYLDDSTVDQRVAEGREAVVRSLAYNAKGKPGIEGAFGNIEQGFFSGIQGWTAGERMRKKTHQKGKDPIPFQGDKSDFLSAAATQLEWYHKRPQHGRLKGRSPNEALRAHIDNGWGKTVLASDEVLALAFATKETRVVDRGCVQFTPRHGETTRYYNDALLAYGGQSLTIHIPAYNPEYLFCFDGDELICVATPERSYHPLDPAGAREVASRNKYLRRHITEKERHCVLLDLVSETARHNEHLPDAPEIPVASEVNADILSRMATAAAEERAELMAQTEAPKKPQLSQWKTGPNERLSNVTYEDEDEQ
ncbi:Mu transposase C-terminal domain-containing protein [Paracoccaceae bacterium GXU_MW_L88]